MEKDFMLREFSDNDVPLFRKWLYEPHVAKWYHEPLDWMEEVENRKDKYPWLHHYIAQSCGAPIGFCQLYEYHNSGETWHGNREIAGTYSIDYLIGDSSYLKKGFGKAMIGELIEKIRAQEGARCIIVQPEIENKSSCGTLLSCGFVFEEENGIFVMELTERVIDS